MQRVCNDGTYPGALSRRGACSSAPPDVYIYVNRVVPTEEKWIAYRGAAFVLEWVRDAQNAMPGRDFFFAQEESVRAKALALFRWLGDRGRISNREKFKCLGSEGRNLWEFKPTKQLRIIGDFRPGRRFLLAWGCIKKKGDLDPGDIAKAERLLKERDVIEEFERAKSHRN